MKECIHDGKKVTGWDQVTCCKCGWISPSGQCRGIHGGWFPSHDAVRDFDKYGAYPNMRDAIPLER